jgi:hypothetical protein
MCLLLWKILSLHVYINEYNKFFPSVRNNSCFLRFCVSLSSMRSKCKSIEWCLPPNLPSCVKCSHYISFAQSMLNFWILQNNDEKSAANAIKIMLQMMIMILLLKLPVALILYNLHSFKLLCLHAAPYR